MALRQNPFALLTRRLPAPIRNLYFIAIILFFVLLIFVDKHDLLTQYKLNRSRSRLEKDKVYYEQKIKEVQEDQLNVENNKEQFAREKYQMHKADEDVFIIQEKE